MSNDENLWETRVAKLWSHVDSMAPEELVATIDALAAERADDDAAALFERACARDTAGLEADAEKFYRAALATERLDPVRQARAVIQLASTLRILGHLAESERLLTGQLARHSEANAKPVLYDETRAFLALTWVAQGRAVEAAGLALVALAPHLSRYNRSVAGNAEELVTDASTDPGH